MKSHDGTLVPLSIVHKKGLKLDGSNPTIVYGYGAYGISQTPFFRPTWLPWFDRGGVLAVAHVRGGGEYGEDWYKAGYKTTKPNTWRDAIACAEWLVANKYTSTPQMSIMGGSAGGIFVGTRDHRPPRTLRRRSRPGARFRHDARRVLRQWRSQHPGIRHGQDRGGIQGPVRNERLPLGEGRREVSGGAADHRLQRPARRCMGGGQDGRSPHGGDGQRPADPAADQFRRRPWHGLDQEGRSTRSARTPSRSCSGRPA